jgi:hypothetical protein
MSAALQMSTRSAPVPPDASSQAALLGDFAALAQQLGRLQGRQLDGAAAVPLTLELKRIVQSALATVSALERLDATGEDGAAGDFDGEALTWVGVRSRPEGPPRLGDVCFACTFELGIALRGLEEARDDDARLSAVETARRKLYRALHAVARAAPDAERLMGAESLEQRRAAELESSLGVRRLYAQFRRNLRRPDGDGNDAVLTALRYAAGALAGLTASPHYSAVRVSDAALLRRQHERLLEWSRAGRPRDSGLQLLEDISTSASLLRDINRRQELRDHDTELIRTLLADPSLDRAGWLAGLDRLAGLDDALDRLAAQLRASEGTDVVGEILVRLSLLV